MPIYEFKCGNCNARVSLLCRISGDGSKESCPHCGNTNLTRIMSSFASPGSGGQDSCAKCTSSNCGACKH